MVRTLPQGAAHPRECREEGRARPSQGDLDHYRDEQKPFRIIADAQKTLPITILRDANGKTARKFDVRGVPRMIIIDRDGKVAADHTGYGEGSVEEIVEVRADIIMSLFIRVLLHP